VSLFRRGVFLYQTSGTNSAVRVIDVLTGLFECKSGRIDVAAVGQYAVIFS
jgi:hypothetical protein